MDTLVALGSGASFVWSVYALFMMTDAQLHGNTDAVMMYMDEFYFESAAMILTLITVGKMLVAYSKGKTTDALKSLMKDIFGVDIKVDYRYDYRYIQDKKS